MYNVLSQVGVQDIIYNYLYLNILENNLKIFQNFITFIFLVLT
jgi:hypothetical protein